MEESSWSMEEVSWRSLGALWGLSGSSLGTLWGLSGGWGGLGVAMGRSGLERCILHGKTQSKYTKTTISRESGEPRCRDCMCFMILGDRRSGIRILPSTQYPYTKPPGPLQMQYVWGIKSS